MKTGHEFEQGDIIRICLDLDWRPPRALALQQEGSDARRGRVDFYKNGFLVGGIPLARSCVTPPFCDC